MQKLARIARYGCSISLGLMRMLAYLALPIPLSALLAGCAVGPDFVRPAISHEQTYSAELLALQSNVAQAANDAQKLVPERDIPGQWWTLFRSKPLNALIDRALAANPDLQAAQAALKIAQENVLAQEGAFYPGVQASYSPSRQRNAVGTISPTLTSGTQIFNLHTAQVNVAYVLDVFGGNRRQVESFEAQAEEQRFQLEAAYLSLTANVVLAAVQEATLRGQIAATEKIVSIDMEQKDLLRRQYELGEIAMADVQAQEAALAQAEATLPPLKKQLALQRNLLAALTGRFPNDKMIEKFELSNLELPQELPLTLPAQLVEQRPDVRASEAQFHAASAQVGVATANMLPQISLSAAYGGTATTLGQMFLTNNIFWSLAGNFSQTLFQGGTLLHRKRAAVAAMDQAAAQYRSTVISAFRNVADTLQALDNDTDALKANVRAEHAAAESLKLTRRQLQLGSISYLSLLNAEQIYQQALVNLVQARGNRFADTVALFQALGGGWWNREDVVVTDKVAPLTLGGH